MKNNTSLGGEQTSLLLQTSFSSMKVSYPGVHRPDTVHESRRGSVFFHSPPVQVLLWFGSTRLLAWFNLLDLFLTAAAAVSFPGIACTATGSADHSDSDLGRPSPSPSPSPCLKADQRLAPSRPPAVQVVVTYTVAVVAAAFVVIDQLEGEVPHQRLQTAEPVAAIVAGEGERRQIAHLLGVAPVAFETEACTAWKRGGRRPLKERVHHLAACRTLVLQVGERRLEDGTLEGTAKLAGVENDLEVLVDVGDAYAAASCGEEGKAKNPSRG